MSRESPKIWHHIVRTALGEVRHWSWPLKHENIDDSVTLVDPFFGGTHTTPLDRVLVELPLDFGATDVLVLRGVTAEEILKSHVPVEELQRRLGARLGNVPAVAVLDFETSGGLLPRLKCKPLAGTVLTQLEELESWLRATEMHSQLFHTGAIYRPGGVHFQLPSGVHADAYIRVADAFDNITTVSRVADWLQHRLTVGTVLLSDTWTTLPLLQELAYRLQYSHSQGPQRIEATAERIISFPQYPTFTQIRQTLDRIPPVVSGYPDAKVLFLVSVISSGELVRTLRSLTSEHLPGIDVEVVALLNTASQVQDVDSFALIEEIARFDVAREPCKLCLNSETRPVVLIDSRRYFPVFEAEHRPIMLRGRFARIHQWFWEVASREDAVRVHVDEHSTGQARHLHLSLDVARLLKNSDLSQKIRTELASFAPDTDLVLIPKHPATEALVTLAERVFPKATIKEIVRSGDDTPFRNYLRETLPTKRRILIFDDVAITGRTLKSVHRLVQGVAQEVARNMSGPPVYLIRAFVVLARPDRPSMWTYWQDSFLQNGAESPFLGCHALIPLPNYCPWCEEQEFLEHVQRRISARNRAGQVMTITERSHEVLESRLRRLRTSAEGGLAGSVFVCDKHGNLTETGSDWLSPNSLFGQGLSETAAYGAVCAAMHAIRFDKDTIGKQGTSWYWDVIRIINAYHDPLLQASFLRVARREELLFPYRAELMAAVQNTLFDSVNSDLRQSGVIIGEHALAAAMEKYGSSLQAIVLDECEKVAVSWNSELSHFLQGLALEI